MKLSRTVFVVLTSLVLDASLAFAIDENARFSIDKQGIITDSETHLQWYVGPDRSTDWDQANAWVKNLAVDGGGWRMPTSVELKRICIRVSGSGLRGDHHDLSPVFKTGGWYMWSIERLITSCCCSSGSSRGGRAFAVRSRSEAVEHAVARIPKITHMEVVSVNPNSCEVSFVVNVRYDGEGLRDYFQEHILMDIGLRGTPFFSDQTTQVGYPVTIERVTKVGKDYRVEISHRFADKSEVCKGKALFWVNFLHGSEKGQGYWGRTKINETNCCESAVAFTE